nr:hypothetical protein [Tanacetum cinerariifolium]
MRQVIEIVIPEVGGIDDDILLMNKVDILREKLLNVNLLISKIEALNANPTPSSDYKTKSSSTSLNSLLEETNTFDNSLPEFETFCFDVKEISSGSTTTYPDISLPEYEAFHDDHVKEISSDKNFSGMSIEIQKKEKLLQQEQSAYLSTHPSKRLTSFCYDDDDKDYTFAIIPDEPVLSTEEPDNSLSMGDEHLDTISATESDEFIKSGVENLIPIPKISSGSPTTHSDSSLCASFNFDLSINPFPPADKSDSYEFTDELIPFISPPENEDAIFDPGICNSHFSRPDVSHRCGTVKKFNTHRSHLDECPMLINGQNNPILDVLLFYFYPPLFAQEHEPKDDDEDPDEDPNEEHKPEDEDSNETEPFEEDKTAVTPPPPKHRGARISVRPQIPTAASTKELIDTFAAGSSLFLLPPTSPAYDQAPLGHKAVICMDIANITRKEPKTRQKRTREWKEYTRAGFFKQSQPKSTLVNLGVKFVKKVAKSDLDSDSSIRLRFCGKKSDFEQDWRTNGKALRKCILSGPYKPTTVLVQDVEATDNSPVVPEHTIVETPSNMSLENKAHFLAEREAIHLILTGIGDGIYSTVDACQTAQEIWEAIERSSAPSPKPLISSRSHTATGHKGKEIAKPITPPSKTASEEDSDPEQAQRDKDMQKNLTLIAKYFKKIYKPTNNNLRTSSNSKNKNVDTTPRYKNDDHSGQFGTQRTVNVAVARENVGSKVVQQSGIQCFNCREFGHFTKECRKPKRVKDSAYHKEKMLLYKQAEQGVPLQAEQYDWLADTDEEVDEQELEAHYSYMAKIHEVPTADSGTYSEPVEQNKQNDVKSDDERVALANLKLDVDENRKIQKQLKKASTTLAQELKECKAILAETSKSLGESISVRDSCLVALQTKQVEFEKFKAFNDRTIDYDKLKRKLNEALGQLAHKDTA